jgi:gluconate 2-dehydrogenase gamma chain
MTSGADGDLRVLTPPEARALAAIADRIFPRCPDMPSASELGAIAYVDGQLAGPWGAGAGMYRSGPWERPEDAGHGWQAPFTPAEAYRHGLAALRSAVLDRHGVDFTELPPGAQDEVLADLEGGRLPGFGDLPGPAFFALLHRTVVEGVLSDPRHGGNRDAQAWRWLGFPGPPT